MTFYINIMPFILLYALGVFLSGIAIAIAHCYYGIYKKIPQNFRWYEYIFALFSSWYIPCSILYGILEDKQGKKYWFLRIRHPFWNRRTVLKQVFFYKEPKRKGLHIREKHLIYRLKRKEIENYYEGYRWCVGDLIKNFPEKEEEQQKFLDDWNKEWYQDAYDSLRYLRGNYVEYIRERFVRYYQKRRKWF